MWDGWVGGQAVPLVGVEGSGRATVVLLPAAKGSGFPRKAKRVGGVLQHTSHRHCSHHQGNRVARIEGKTSDGLSHGWQILPSLNHSDGTEPALSDTCLALAEDFHRRLLFYPVPQIYGWCKFNRLQ